MILRVFFVAFLSSWLASPALAACVNSLTREAPDSRYLVDGAVVTDTQTGLIWARCSLGLGWSEADGRCIPGPSGAQQQYTWAEAITASANASWAGYTDWRLPNKNELASLIDRACSGPAMNTTVLTAGPVGYWSSTPGRREEGYAWHYKQYSKNTDLAKAESSAKKEAKGLWVSHNPIPPWEYRRSNSLNLNEN